MRRLALEAAVLVDFVADVESLEHHDEEVAGEIAERAPQCEGDDEARGRRTPRGTRVKRKPAFWLLDRFTIQPPERRRGSEA